MRNAERYTRIVNEGITIGFNDRETAISIRYTGVDRLSDMHQIEFWMFSIVRMCRQMTGTRLAPRRFAVRHSRKATPAECRAFLGCDITYGAESDQIVLPPVVTQLPMVGADRHLHEMLLRYAEETLAKRTPDRAQIRARVEGAIGRLLPHGKANASAVAREIGVSRRTLARLLSAEGLTYSMVLEQYKCDLATSHLAEGNLSISEIAWLLGYREVSAFTHAFKRWVGLTPSDVREGAAPSTDKVNS
jgi:AraC-like DNA-binding protein